MKTITQYECETCGRRYAERKNAEQCEARITNPELPIGLMRVDTFYGDRLAFAVANQRLEGHFRHTSMWACRDDQSGGVLDSLGDATCGNGNTFTPIEFELRWVKLPPFLRLKAWLESQGITPTVMVDDTIVPLDEAVTLKTG